jgi:transposase
MPHPQHTFAIALPSQCMTDFVRGNNETLRFFGGLPKVILLDNLKAFVIKSDHYDPDFNDVMVQLANHYHIDLKAARAYEPKDKASVENAVGTAYTPLYAPLRPDFLQPSRGQLRPARTAHRAPKSRLPAARWHPRPRHEQLIIRRKRRIQRTFSGAPLLHPQLPFLMTTVSLSTLHELKLGGMADPYEASCPSLTR